MQLQNILNSPPIIHHSTKTYVKKKTKKEERVGEVSAQTLPLGKKRKSDSEQTIFEWTTPVQRKFTVRTDKAVSTHQTLKTNPSLYSEPPPLIVGKLKFHPFLVGQFPQILGRKYTFVSLLEDRPGTIQTNPHAIPSTSSPHDFLIGKYEDDSQMPYIVKIYTNLERAKKEIGVLKFLKKKNFPHIVEYIEYMKSPNKIAIITKHAGKCVQNLLHFLSLEEKFDIMIQLITCIIQIESYSLINTKLSVSELCYDKGCLRVLEWSKTKIKALTGFSKNIHDAAEVMFEIFTCEEMTLENMHDFKKFVKKIHKKLPDDFVDDLFLLFCHMYRKEKNLSAKETYAYLLELHDKYKEVQLPK